MPKNIPGMARAIVRTPWNLLLNRIDPPVIVLVYHRVAALAADPEMLAVSPENFRAQMRYLKDTFPLVRFDEDWSNRVTSAIAVTFDDGYADNVLEALPILEEVGVPATFFVSTGAIGTAAEFWWHELERIILGDRSLPPLFTTEDQRLGKIWLTGSHDERQAFYRDMVHLLNNAEGGDRNWWLRTIRDWGGAVGDGSGTHRSMTVEELRLLAAGNQVTIGAHTVTHSRLAALTPNEQRHEIFASKRQLEQWLDREVTVFSYPFGRRRDYNRDSIAFCVEAGYRKAAANFPGQAHRWTDPYQIPRHLVRDWQVEIFREKLQGFWKR